MTELSIKDLEIVFGGGAFVIHTSRAIMSSPAGKASVANAAAGAGGYLGGSYLSGNQPTVSGTVGAATAGAVLGPVKVATPSSTLLWGGLSGYVEGSLNGKGPLRPEFLDSSDKSGNDYGDPTQDKSGNSYGG
ncbi:hypothetical protein [Neisseria dentiae]|uniref:hypothetical protein n=1 Tax=Neisseria dentiae TaxID=194197 RepID=UPI0035A06833